MERAGVLQQLVPVRHVDDLVGYPGCRHVVAEQPRPEGRGQLHAAAGELTFCHQRARTATNRNQPHPSPPFAATWAAATTHITDVQFISPSSERDFIIHVAVASAAATLTLIAIAAATIITASVAAILTLTDAASQDREVPIERT